MKKIWIYLLGILTGVFITFLISLIVDRSKNSGISFFEKPGEVITVECFGRTEIVKRFKVFQTLGEDAGLAVGDDLCAQDLLVLIYGENGQSLFDNQTISATKGKSFRQIGIYKYKSNDKMHRTIPVVMLVEDDVEESEMDDDDFSELFHNKDYTFFDDVDKMKVMQDKSYRIDKVLDNGTAIAIGKKDNLDDEHWLGLKVLLWDEGENFYNDQIIKAPKGMHFRQIGVYKSSVETLPVVTLMTDE